MKFITKIATSFHFHRAPSQTAISLNNNKNKIEESLLLFICVQSIHRSHIIKRKWTLHARAVHIHHSSFAFSFALANCTKCARHTSNQRWCMNWILARIRSDLLQFIRFAPNEWTSSFRRRAKAKPVITTMNNKKAAKKKKQSRK